MTRRKLEIHIRLTPEEMENWRARAGRFVSLSNFIRQAVAEYSDISARARLENIAQLGRFYREYQSHIAHIGGNLNQVVKRANELAAANLLSDAYIRQVVVPAVNEALETLAGIRKALDSLNKSITRL